MPEQPSSSTRAETALPIAQWPLHSCTHPSCLMSPLAHHEQLSFSRSFSTSQLLSRKVSNSQKEELCHQMHTRPFWREPKLPLYPVQQLQKQRGALACGQSRGCTLQLKVSQKKTEGDHHSFPQSLCALLMATGGFGVKDGVTWYMLGNTLLAGGEGYSLGKKIMEENSNYENRKYTHKRKHYCTVR